jgi:hypothetical protein
MTSSSQKAENPRSVKLEMTAKELNMMVYMLGAIDLRTDPATLEIALALRKKLDNAQKFVNKKPERPKDKYGKPLTDDEIKQAQEIAAQANSKSNKHSEPHRVSPPAENS